MRNGGRDQICISDKWFAWLGPSFPLGTLGLDIFFRNSVLIKYKMTKLGNTAIHYIILYVFLLIYTSLLFSWDFSEHICQTDISEVPYIHELNLRTKI